MILIWYLLIGLLVSAIYIGNYNRKVGGKKSNLRKNMDKIYKTKREFYMFCFYLVYLWLPLLIATHLNWLQSEK